MNQLKEAVRRNLNVEAAANDLDGATIDLTESISALANHLQPLLADERPWDVGPDRARGDSEVAERILSNADRARDGAARIRDLIDRL